MQRVLRLYNSFSRSINEVRLDGKLLSAQNSAELRHGSFYICGPTVYSDSHLGHAITYTRADLFRRFMKSIFNVDLTTVMNITDIDDKILTKTIEDERASPPKNGPEHIAVTLNSDPLKHPFRRVSERYYKSFLDDMQFIRVKPPDIPIKVSQQIDLIIRYIQKLEKDGHAYIAANGDIYFKVQSIQNYIGRTDERRSGQFNNPEEEFKLDTRDFALWKAAKPNEPIWNYKSSITGQRVPGRPGWHVQCSAISSAIFGRELDFHFGGKDLIFPHHYNEQACCCAYHNLDTSKNLHVWAKNWLHSGHLTLRDDKMSKSTGNVIGIRHFISNSSVNSLRLLCIGSHYRADVNFNDDLLREMRSLDHKISAFVSYLNEQLSCLAESSLALECDVRSPNEADMQLDILQTHDEMLLGICNDFDLDQGLKSLLELSKRVYNAGSGNIRACDLVSIWHLTTDWCATCGLEYGPLSKTHDQNLITLLSEFRQKVRQLALDELRGSKEDKSNSHHDQILPKSILESCDNLRTILDESGYVKGDKKHGA